MFQPRMVPHSVPKSSVGPFYGTVLLVEISVTLPKIIPSMGETSWMFWEHLRPSPGNHKGCPYNGANVGFLGA
jgi:hypothetical protein